MEAGLCGSRRGYCVRWQEEMVPRIRRLFFPLVLSVSLGTGWVTKEQLLSVTKSRPV